MFVRVFEDMVVLLSDIDLVHQTHSHEAEHICVQHFQLLLNDLLSAECSSETTQRKIDA